MALRQRPVSFPGGVLICRLADSSRGTKQEPRKVDVGRLAEEGRCRLIDEDHGHAIWRCVLVTWLFQDRVGVHRAHGSHGRGRVRLRQRRMAAGCHFGAVGEMASEQMLQPLQHALIGRHPLVQVGQVLFAHKNVGCRLGGLILTDKAKPEARRARRAVAVAPGGGSTSASKLCWLLRPRHVPGFAHTARIARQGNAPSLVGRGSRLGGLL
jgi:hypothetical protein